MERAPVMVREVQGVNQDPTRPSSPGQLRTRGVIRADRTWEVERVPLTASPRRGLVWAASAQGRDLGEPGVTRGSLFYRTSNQPVTVQAVLFQEVSRVGSLQRQRQQAPRGKVDCRFSTGQKVPERGLAVASRSRPGRGPTWPGRALPIRSNHQRPATCRRRALPQTRKCRA